MVARFEFEIDTTHAVESWEDEVAENLAAARGRRPEPTKPSGQTTEGPAMAERAERRPMSADAGGYARWRATRCARARSRGRKNSAQHTSVQWTAAGGAGLRRSSALQAAAASRAR